jgi:hypothetical protein
VKVLVACESSGVVRDAFIAAGFEAVSCDLEPSEAPGPHLQRDVLTVLDLGWDLMIAHPPCTYLCRAGARWWNDPNRVALRTDALAFVRTLMKAPIPRIAIENPPGHIGTAIRKADQYIQPWQFGHDEQKLTGLWLKNLPRLEPSRIVDPPFYGCRCGYRFEAALGKYGCPNCGGASGAVKPIYSNQTPSGQNRLGPGRDRARLRSRTYEGIARAMALQWGLLS